MIFLSRFQETIIRDEVGCYNIAAQKSRSIFDKFEINDNKIHKRVPVYNVKFIYLSISRLSQHVKPQKETNISSKFKKEGG